MRPLAHESRLVVVALLAGLPGSAIAIILIWTGDYSSGSQWTLTVLILAFWLGFALSARSRVAFPLMTLSNLLAALREGDYSIRARGGRRSDALGELAREVNVLGDTLREQRLEALEASALLRRVMEAISVAVFAIDADLRLRLVNRAGERLLGQPSERLLGLTTSELGLKECLEGEPRTVQMSFPGGSGRWEIHRSAFRERGLPHQLLVLSDVSRVLRQEERHAWRRLIRVIGHELNNSLTPIKSLAGSLSGLVCQGGRPADWEEDMRKGLKVIEGRAEALSGFLEAYARLARLPAPRREPLDVNDWVRRVAALETRLPVRIQVGPEITVSGDRGQLEQLLINLIRNAVDVLMDSPGEVEVGWRKNGKFIEVWVRDDGPGLPDTSNLFVPFFTTKPGGSGIGLVLSREIAEAHGGELTLSNRAAGRGCEALLRLPLQS